MDEHGQEEKHLGGSSLDVKWQGALARGSKRDSSLVDGIGKGWNSDFVRVQMKRLVAKFRRTFKIRLVRFKRSSSKRVSIWLGNVVQGGEAAQQQVDWVDSEA